MPLPHAFEVTIQKSQVWLDDVLDELRTDDRQLAYAILGGVLHALRDRLPQSEVVDLGAQLPMLLRGLYYDGWTFHDRSTSLRKKDAFLRHVGKCVKRTDITPEEAVRVVFAVLARRVTAGEIRDVIGTLPETFDELWPASATQAH
jgi:uncharacterized protein (DUF2267 family)